jgi:hypothetical protein
MGPKEGKSKVANKAFILFFFCMLFGVMGCNDHPDTGNNLANEQMNQRLEMYEQRERLRILESSAAKPLTAQEFQNIWNSIDSDMNRGLPLGKVTVQKDQQGVSFFQKQFAPYLNMKVTLSASGNVDSILIGATPKTKLERFMMLGSWAQMISTTSKVTEPAEITKLFHDMGVDANADLSLIENKTVIYQGATYQTRLENPVYEFSYQGVAAR